jgi:hypothetical protein
MVVETQYIGCAPCRMVWRVLVGLEACPACHTLTNVKRLKYGERFVGERSNSSRWYPRVVPGDCIICHACYHHRRVNDKWLKEANDKLKNTSSRSPYLTINDRSRLTCSACAALSASIFHGAQARNNSPSKLIQLVKESQLHYEELERQTEIEVVKSEQDSHDAEAYWRARGAYDEFDVKVNEENRFEM